MHCLNTGLLRELESSTLLPCTCSQALSSTQVSTMVALRHSLLLLLSACSSAKWIVPGARWRDTDGDIFNAHAGGLCLDQKTGKFYWFGEFKPQEQVEGAGISVYSSDDLATWTSHGIALGRVLFCKSTKSELTYTRTYRGSRVHLARQRHSASQGHVQRRNWQISCKFHPPSR